MEKARINEIIDEALKNKKHAAADVEDRIAKDYLTIKLDANLLAIQLEYLREVFELPDILSIIPVPFSPSYILGIINVREEIIPVLSFSQLLGLASEEKKFFKIAVIEEKFKIAIPFTDILDLKSVPIRQIQDCKDVRKTAREQFINQEFTYDGQVIRIVDILKLFASEFLT
jgi:purine-binding chemotaxis protein CheW